MTYRELMKAISLLDEQQLDSDVTIYLTYSDEFCPASSNLLISNDSDVLDYGHPFITIFD